MIHIFYGNDRVKAEKEADKILGPNRETIDAENLEPADFPTIFLGTTLFEAERKIILKDFLTKKSRSEELLKYVDTPHEIVIITDSFNKTISANKTLAADKKVDAREFKVAETVDRFLSFNIFDEALINGESAVRKLRAAEENEVAQLMVGAWASKATKNFASRPTPKNKRILKELAKLDLVVKTTKFAENPWPALELFLLRLKNL